MRKLYFVIALVLIARYDLRAQWVRDTIISPMRGLYSMVTLEDTLYVSSGTILRSTDEGNTWQNWDNGLFRGYAYWPFVGDGHFFLATVAGFGPPEDTNYEKSFRSTDAGATWFQVNIKKFYLGANALTTIGNTFYTPGYYSGLFRSIDSGATWAIATDSVNSGLLADSHVNCVLQWDGLTFAGSDTGIFITMDSGESWHLRPSADTLREIHSLISLGPYIFVAAGDSLFRSSDSGRSWVNIEIFPYFALMSNFLLGKAGGNLLVCNGYLPVLFSSPDNGFSWHYAGQGLDTTYTSGAFYTSQNFVYVDNIGEYLYRRPRSDFDQSGVASSSISNAISISIFPNPARDALQVLGGPSGTARLFDLLGRERAEARDDGASVTLDISHIEAGPYFLRVGTQSAKVEIAH
ncbi:MAG TPA: T9SS type A sorting domain-containing protein [Candidatus Kapabacteria bacterium]|nr:T9SS type A sorting domain-containing protein [Candidatus Kapabacteria bacterium]